MSSSFGRIAKKSPRDRIPRAVTIPPAAEATVRTGCGYYLPYLTSAVKVERS
jgi:hypothetical protein